MYKEAKSSLKKFKGDEGAQREKSSIELKPAYLAENEEALLAAGFVKVKAKNNSDNRRGPRWDWGGFVRNNCNRGSQRNFSPKFTMNKKMNPVGTDGWTLPVSAVGLLLI